MLFLDLMRAVKKYKPDKVKLDVGKGRYITIIVRNNEYAIRCSFNPCMDK